MKRAIFMLLGIFLSLAVAWGVFIVLDHLLHIERLLELEGAAFLAAFETIVVGSGLAYIMFGKALIIQTKIEELLRDAFSGGAHSDSSHSGHDLAPVLRWTFIFAGLSIVLYAFLFAVERLSEKL
ncbi:hypothetical protein [Cupriavidus pampae]|uniref:Uncharacterized protein n=1 Tax=Cupriavidus pampae TaxID=659251 RepID=A0ABN7YX80_9BURK|nr:hypothetical protein [Cupriavidus pampae]CAG9178055.1 hypothetical protein LMG32289_03980 [Cupriavidus pampae]